MGRLAAWLNSSDNRFFGKDLRPISARKLTPSGAAHDSGTRDYARIKEASYSTIFT